MFNKRIYEIPCKTKRIADSKTGRVSKSVAPKKTDLGDYQIDLDFFDKKPSVRILFLTDLHWEYEKDKDRQAAYLNALVKNANPDFIMLGGDLARSVSNRNYETVFKVLEGFSSLLGRDLYYGLTWGNHDEQWHWDDLTSGNLAKTNPHCLYIEVDDDLTGESNYLFNLRKGGKTLWQIYSLDSNSMANYPSVPNVGYDTVHEEQISWFEQEVLEAKKSNPDVKNLVFMHIPLWENEYAYRLSVGKNLNDYSGEVGYLGRHSGIMLEKREKRGDLGMTNTCTSNERSTFFERAEKLGATSAIFFGHDHNDDFAAEYKLKEEDNYISLVYGLKSGDGLYYEPSLLGGTMVEIGENMSFSMMRCFQSYQEDYEGKKGYREEKVYQ